MNVNTIIVDDFLPNPDVVRSQAVQLDFPVTGQFPGVRSLAADNEYQMFIAERFRDILGTNVSQWKMDSFCFQLCYEGEETWAHVDESKWAGVLYLTPDAPYESGTGFYEQTGDDEYELVTAVGNKYNRLVLYKGDLLHRSIMSGFGNTPDTGRLTQVFFFDIDKKWGGTLGC